MSNIYLRLIWRNFARDRQFALLNLLGLSTGLAAAILIYIWVADELQVDHYNAKDDRLYQVMSNIKGSDGIKTGEFTPGLLAPALKAAMPEIEYAATVMSADWFPYKGGISYNDKKFRVGGDYVSKEYFDVFSATFTAGTGERLFDGQHNVAVSLDLAKKLFGDADAAIGKMVNWDQGEFAGSFAVCAVFEKTPRNATRQFDLLFNFDLVLARRPNLLDFGNSDPNTYLILKDGTDATRLNAKLQHFLQTRKTGSEQELFATRYSDKYLHGKYENGKRSGGRIAYVRLFSIIAIFILVIACINFTNLSTARASRRLKEVGMKKVMGARKGQLVLQYMGESMLMSFIALLIAAVIIYLFLPVFNTITGKSLVFSFQPGIVAAMVVITAVTGVLAGSYPAIYLSRFKPVSIMKGRLTASIGELWTRRALMVFQFTLSVLFIAVVMVVYRQLNYIQSRNLGYQRDQVLHFEIPLENDSAKIVRATTFLNEVRKVPGVVSASSYYHNLTGHHGGIGGFEWPGKSPGKDIDFANLEVGYHFLETAGITIREGRNFSPDDNAGHEIIFNETAIRQMGLKDPIGKTVRFWGMDRQIVGVAADFNFESLYQSVKPCFFQVYPVMPNVMVRLQAGEEQKAIAGLQKVFDTFNPGASFDYCFLDEDYRNLYASEQRVGVLAKYFAALAILISCLGLFGLAAFTAQRRQKEIGIRKVIGASAAQVAMLLSSEFIQLVLLSLLLAFPLVWWIMNGWLNDFAYHVNIRPDIFVFTGAMALCITVLTISFQAIRAAIANPVESLRSE